jgi:hypothetical protein
MEDTRTPWPSESQLLAKSMPSPRAEVPFLPDGHVRKEVIRQAVNGRVL